MRVRVTQTCQADNSTVEPPSPAVAEFFDNQEWIRAEDASRYLGLSLGALRNLTSNGVIPHYKLGRRVRYRIEELRALLLQNRRGVKNGN
jgi:excisionase family DNA binding protein